MHDALIAIFAFALGACCLLLGACVEVGLDHVQHHAAEGRLPDAEPVGAAADTELFHI